VNQGSLGRGRKQCACPTIPAQDPGVPSSGAAGCISERRVRARPGESITTVSALPHKITNSRFSITQLPRPARLNKTLRTPISMPSLIDRSMRTSTQPLHFLCHITARLEVRKRLHSSENLRKLASRLRDREVYTLRYQGVRSTCRRSESSTGWHSAD
jgi:hypothetical protein